VDLDQVPAGVVSPATASRVNRRVTYHRYKCCGCVYDICTCCMQVLELTAPASGPCMPYTPCSPCPRRSSMRACICRPASAATAAASRAPSHVLSGHLLQHQRRQPRHILAAATDPGAVTTASGAIIQPNRRQLLSKYDYTTSISASHCPAGLSCTSSCITSITTFQPAVVAEYQRNGSCHACG
jgi:hypothetical protein